MRNQYFEITPGRGQSAQLSRGSMQRRNARVLAQRPQRGWRRMGDCLGCSSLLVGRQLTGEFKSLENQWLTHLA